MKALIFGASIIVALWVFMVYQKNRYITKWRRNLTVNQIVRCSYSNDDLFEIKEFYHSRTVVKIVNVATGSVFHVNILNLRPI